MAAQLFWFQKISYKHKRFFNVYKIPTILAEEHLLPSIVCDSPFSFVLSFDFSRDCISPATSWFGPLSQRKDWILNEKNISKIFIFCIHLRFVTWGLGQDKGWGISGRECGLKATSSLLEIFLQPYHPPTIFGSGHVLLVKHCLKGPIK